MNKKHVKHYLLNLALCIIAILSAVDSNAAGNVVRVGFCNIPGYHNLTPNGERSGYGYDFLQLVRRHTKLEFTYTGYNESWKHSLTMLERGEIDLLTGALRTPERESKFDYSFPIGSTNLNLYIHNKDERYRPGEYTSYTGMRIGTVKSEMLDERMKRMADRNHFKCTIVDFDNFDAMCKALDNGKIDAMCGIGTHRLKGYRILNSFDYENIYAIVRKGNSELLHTINEAIIRMDQTETMWQQKLFEGNYIINQDNTLEFTEKELDFIRRHSTPETAIKIATDNTWKPYSWYEKGKYRGIVVEIVDSLMKHAGLQYEFVDGEISSERVLKSRRDVDLYVDFVSTQQYAEEQGLVVSPAFMHPNISIVSYKSYDQLKTVGLAQNTPMLNMTAKRRYKYDFVVIPTTEELINALKNGEIDGAMVYDYVAQLYVNTEEDKKMQISFLPGMTLPLHMVTRNTDERELITIISKCINHQNHAEMDIIATKYLSAAEKEVSVWKFLKKNPWFPVLVIFFSLLGFMIEKYKRMKMELQKQKLLEVNIAANEAKTKFLHNMSHEIRTPLNAMYGFSQLLGMPDGTFTEEEKTQYNRYIYNSYRMLEMLISDILDIADSEHGNYRIDITDVRVNDVCQNALQSVEFRVPAGVQLRFTTDCPAELTIQSDERRIQQVLINYLTNACKYTEQGEIHLHCSLTENPDCITFSVADTGTGVPQEKAEVIFSRFTKLNQFVQGSGLGLNICQTIATKLGGRVSLDTSYSTGARFLFILPLQNQAN